VDSLASRAMAPTRPPCLNAFLALVFTLCVYISFTIPKRHCAGRFDLIMGLLYYVRCVQGIIGLVHTADNLMSSYLALLSAFAFVTLSLGESTGTQGKKN